jgi:hypothetical protein
MLVEEVPAPDVSFIVCHFHMMRFLSFSLALRRFGEKTYAAAKMTVAVRTTEAPEGRSKM